MPEQNDNLPTTEAADVKPQEFGFPVAMLRQLALDRPRDERKALDIIADEMEQFPQIAEEAYYSIPYKNRTKVDGQWTEETVFVEGLSVKAAKAIGRRWGNCVFEGSIVQEDGDTVICRGICLDLETLYLASVQKVAKRTYTVRGGSGVRRLNDEKWSQKIDSTISKCVRNAILDTISGGAKAFIFDKARSIVAHATGAALEEATGKALAFCERKGITVEQVEKLMEKPTADFTWDDLGTLRGVLNAIQQGEKTAQEVFGAVDPAADKTTTEKAEDAAKDAAPDPVSGPELFDN